jgi:hypothetical protein
VSKSGVSFPVEIVAVSSVEALFLKLYKAATASTTRTRQIKGTSHLFRFFWTRFFGLLAFFPIPILFLADLCLQPKEGDVGSKTIYEAGNEHILLSELELDGLLPKTEYAYRIPKIE